MQFSGKLVGAILGLFLLRSPWGLLIGLVLGHFYDQSVAARARVFNQDFAAVTRYLLTTSDRQTVPLDEELAFVRRYAALLSIRFGDAFRVLIEGVDADGPGLPLEVPPTALQLLVENAAKHNAFHARAPLVVRVRIDEARGTATVENARVPRDGVTPASISSGVPRAIIPPLTDVGLGSGVGSDSGFDLSSAPLRPVPQRFAFEAQSLAAAATSPMPAFDAQAATAEGFGQKSTIPHWAADFSNGNGDSRASLPHPDQIMDLKPLGQVSASFIIAVNGAGLWIVDQHVAHERVLFEQHLEARRAGKVESQRMLMPVVIDLSPRQIVIFEKIAEELAANGFEVEPMGPKSFALQAVPAGVLASDAEKLLTEILDGLDRENAAISIDTLQAKIAASTACHEAIKINMPLDQTKMEWLLSALAKTDCPMSCPHGRPVVLRYSIKEIEKAFHRI